MRSGLSEARLRRLASELKPAEAADEAAARQALHNKLDAMAARLREGDANDRGDFNQRAPNQEDTVDELSSRLEALVNDPTATDAEIERAIADLRIARLKADVALKIVSFADTPAEQVTNRPQPV